QSTPLREGRQSKRLTMFLDTAHFNPRPYVRGDRDATAPPTPFLHFNPRPYVRGDSKYSQNYINKKHHIVNFAK
ncbi:MAG: hypothetical protein SOX14_00375, partial [Ruminococcus callidus]|nr:hypothetical protein [Ruminococcus callidus]